MRKLVALVAVALGGCVTVGSDVADSTHVAYSGHERPSFRLMPDQDSG